MDLTLPIRVTPAAQARIDAIAAAEGARKLLRVAVLGGGCSGFQYEFGLEDAPRQDDLVLAGRVLVDPESLPFLSGSVIDFKDELIGARFAIDNPNATASCGCGTSFSI
jgi:iron-sulfur cluster assembly accessory protein